MTEPDLKKTPLFPAYQRYGGKLIPFGEWSLPVSFSGIKDEHVAVRERAGLFDASHMGEIRVAGKAGLAFLQRVTTNDVSRLALGRAQYSSLLNEQAGIIDDIFIYRIAEDEFFLCVNASNAAGDYAWLKSQAPGGVEVIDERAKWAQLALQGPKAREILSAVSDGAAADVKWFSIKEIKVLGVSVLCAGTGYTGSGGFEIFMPPENAVEIWDGLLDQGQDQGLVPCGLGARDTLRLEMGYPLHGHDITIETTPLEADLEWIVAWDKRDFIGRPALLKQKKEGIKRKRAGMEMQDRAVAREHYKVRAGNNIIGEVTSGTRTPCLEKAIAVGYLAIEHANPGQEVEIEVRDKWHPAKVVAMPFYKRK